MTQETQDSKPVQQAELNIFTQDKAVGRPECELVIQVKQPLDEARYAVTEFRFTTKTAFTLLQQLATKVKELQQLNAVDNTPEELIQ